MADGLADDLPQTCGTSKSVGSGIGVYKRRSFRARRQDSLVASTATSTDMGVRGRKADDRSSVVFHVVLAAKVFQLAVWIDCETIRDSSYRDLQRVGGGQY